MQRSPVRAVDLRWDDVRLFLALCRARTVGQAARELGVDASTVSRRLVALEQAVSASLFDRTRDGISATKAAEDLMPAAEQMEEQMTRFAQAIDGLEREVSGLVRVACPSDVASVVLVPLVRELLARHPQLRVQIDPGETLVDLTRREADLALRTVRPTRGDLVVTKLATVPWVLVAAPALARSLGRLRSWDDAPWIGWGERFAAVAPARWQAKHVRSSPVVRSDGVTVFAAAVAGLGVTLAPTLTAAHYGLVPVPIGARLRRAAEAWPIDELFLVTHRSLRQVPRVRAIWDLLVERVAIRAAHR